MLSFKPLSYRFEVQSSPEELYARLLDALVSKKGRSWAQRRYEYEGTVELDRFDLVRPVKIARALHLCGEILPTDETLNILIAIPIREHISTGFLTQGINVAIALLVCWGIGSMSDRNNTAFAIWLAVFCLGACALGMVAGWRSLVWRAGEEVKLLAKFLGGTTPVRYSTPEAASNPHD